MQQEIAEKLERERKHNKKELLALQSNNATILRQRDEAQRVVLHLRSLISGQTHHMEHIVRSLNEGRDLSESIEEGLDNLPQEFQGRVPVDGNEDAKAVGRAASPRDGFRLSSNSIGSARQSIDGSNVSPDMENRLFDMPTTDRRSKRFSELNMGDVADRHLRDKTDAIADIIRNISDQCAAAIEGLQLAHDAEHEDEIPETTKSSDTTVPQSDDGQALSLRTEGSEFDGAASENGTDAGLLTPDGRASSIPPTPELVHNRSSTSMSIVSASTAPTDRASQGYSHTYDRAKVVQGDEEHELGSDAGQPENSIVSKHQADDMPRPTTARIGQ